MSNTEPTAEKPKRVFFDAILMPHRSLTPKGFAIVMVVLGLISIVVGTAFLMIGAWPVLGFFGLDVALVYFAFRLNYRSGRLRETVTLTDSSLDVRRIQPSGDEKNWSFEPSWVRVVLEGVDTRRAQLVLRSRDLALQIGAFLPPFERKDLAKALERALADRRKALPHLG
jgi:uncharacterized membrane protein